MKCFVKQKQQTHIINQMQWQKIAKLKAKIIIPKEEKWSCLIWILNIQIKKRRNQKTEQILSKIIQEKGNKNMFGCLYKTECDKLLQEKQ